jgi:hypothetical protein
MSHTYIFVTGEEEKLPLSVTTAGKAAETCGNKDKYVLNPRVTRHELFE